LTVCGDNRAAGDAKLAVRVTHTYSMIDGTRSRRIQW